MTILFVPRCRPLNIGIGVSILILMATCCARGQVPQTIPHQRMELVIEQLTDWEQFWVAEPLRTTEREIADATTLYFTRRGTNSQTFDEAVVFVAAIGRRYLFEKGEEGWQAGRSAVAIRPEIAEVNSEAVNRYKMMYKDRFKFGSVHQTQIRVPVTKSPSCFSDINTPTSLPELRKSAVRELRQWATKSCSGVARIGIPRYCVSDPAVFVLLEDPCEVDAQVAIFSQQATGWELEMPPNLVLSGTSDFRHTGAQIRVHLLESVALLQARD